MRNQPCWRSLESGAVPRNKSITLHKGFFGRFFFWRDAIIPHPEFHLSSFEFSIYCPVFQYGKFHQITRCETTKKMKLSTLVQLDSNAEKIWNHKPYPKSTKQGRHWFCRFCHWIKLDIYCSYMCVCICNYMYISTVSIRSPNSLDIRNERFHMTEPKITWAILHFGHKPILSYPSIVIVIILRVCIYIYLFCYASLYIEKCCSYIYISPHCVGLYGFTPPYDIGKRTDLRIPLSVSQRFLDTMSPSDTPHDIVRKEYIHVPSGYD